METVFTWVGKLDLSGVLACKAHTSLSVELAVGAGERVGLP